MTEESLVSETVASALTAIPFVGPFVAPTAMRLLEVIHSEWMRSYGVAMKAAERASNMTKEDLAEQIEREPLLVPLYVRFLNAAAQNGSDRVLAALGTAFAMASLAATRGDSDQVEGIAAALKAIDGMSGTHFVVLAALSVPRTGEDVTHENQMNYLTDWVAEKAGISIDLAAMCLVALAGAGLARTESLMDGLGYIITDLGQAVLLAIDEIEKTT